jgi:hypothetical protein
MLSRVIPVVANGKTLFFFYVPKLLHCNYVPQYLHPLLMDTWWAPFPGWCRHFYDEQGVKILYKVVISLPLGICPKEELLIHKVVLLLISLETSMLFSVILILTTPGLKRSLSPHTHQHLLPFDFLLRANLTGMRWCHIVVILICFSYLLMILSIFSYTSLAFLHLLEKVSMQVF